MTSKTKFVRERIEEALREIGVLLLAFTPLDAAVNSAQGHGSGVLLYFFGLGLCLFGGALLLERRRRSGRVG